MSDRVPATRAPSEASDPACWPPPPPSHIGRYRIERILGEGAFGVVYLAHDDDLRRPVAIKVPQAKRLAKHGAIDAYLAEAQILALLKHPHIVHVYDFGRTDDGGCYIVSEYIRGGSLEGLRRQRRVAIPEAADLIAIVAEALHHAHQHKLVHRDVKPANILLDDAGKPYLADFGIALRDEDFGTGGGLAGTPWYMSPEQARGESHLVDGRADVYALGAVLYELLTGQVPFRRDNLHDLLEDIASLTLEARPPRQLVTDLPRELERICLKALAKRTSERYPTAYDLADDLRALLAQRQPLAVEPTPVALAPATPDSRPVVDITRERVQEDCEAHLANKGPGVFDAGDLRRVKWKAACVGVCAAATLLALGLVWFFWSTFHPADVYAEQLDFWVVRDIGRGKEAIEDQVLITGGNEKQVLPVAALGPDDGFRLEGRLNRPANWYLLWFDPSGQPPTVIPSERPQTEVEYPPRDDEDPARKGWPKVVQIHPNDPPGVHLLLLLVDPESSVNLTDLLQERLNQVGKPPQELPARWAVRLRTPGSTVRLTTRLPSDYLREVTQRLPKGLQPIQAVFFQGRK
jgi:hypothetical protein